VAKADLYDSLMVAVLPIIKNQKIETVTFIWMQGERDANEEMGWVYEKSLLGVYKQLCKDLKRKDINFIIGRLSDYNNPNYEHWDMIRNIQMEVGESKPHFAWINTDDLNSGIDKSGKQVENDLHLTEAGYKTLGERYAEKAISIIENKKMK
jgi:hypothetical protein